MANHIAQHLKGERKIFPSRLAASNCKVRSKQKGRITLHQVKTKLIAPALCLCLATALPLTAVAAPSGSDINGHWGQSAMEAFIDSGYLDAKADGNYGPNEVLTQAQFAAMLGRITGQTGNASSNAAITRQDAAVMVAQTLGLDGQANLSILERFSDSADISSSARSSVAAMVNAGYINGTSAGTFLPNQPLSRAEGVTILNNALGALRVLSADTEVLYGTATLTYAEYYSGDVSSVAGYGVDGVTSSTVKMSGSFNGNMYTNYTEDRTEGYNIFGVQNVNVAVSAADYEAYLAINPTFKVSAAIPNQYKPVTIENGKAVYSATRLNVVETVTDATPVLKTGSVWGDYEIDVVENSTKNLRNDRTDEGWNINANIQGTILETSDGLKIGMEYLQSMWVQPWEVSFNVSADSAQNAHITAWDNLTELSRLVGKSVTSITYIMPDSAYIYTFDGVYIKPVYSGSETVSASLTAGSAQVRISGIPEALQDVTATITYGSGRSSTTVADAVPVVNGAVTMTEVCDSAQTYTVKVSSSNYADIVAAVPMSETQRTQLTSLVESAKALIEGGTAANDDGLIEHYEEALELLASDNATTAEAAELLTELPSHLSVYVTQEQPQQESGRGGEH